MGETAQELVPGTTWIFPDELKEQLGIGGFGAGAEAGAGAGAGAGLPDGPAYPAEDGVTTAVLGAGEGDDTSFDAVSKGKLRGVDDGSSGRSRTGSARRKAQGTAHAPAPLTYFPHALALLVLSPSPSFPAQIAAELEALGGENINEGDA